MTLQEKIIKLRKKNGWSQEDLADKLYVTRQAVSKWESGQSLPDVEKIVHMSKLFGVTTDYLLNEEVESEDVIEESTAIDNKILEKEVVDAFMDNVKKRSKFYAVFLALMFFSPVVLYILKIASVENYQLIGGIVGVITFATAYAFFLIGDNKRTSFNYIRKEQKFVLGYGVSNYVEQIKEHSKKKNDIFMTVSSTILMLVGMMLILLQTIYKDSSNYAFVSDISVLVSLIIMSVVVPMGIVPARENNAYSLLLKKGSYAPERAGLNKKLNLVRMIITSTALIGCLVYMVVAKNDGNSILLFGGIGLIVDLLIEVIVKYFYERNKDKNKSLTTRK